MVCHLHGTVVPESTIIGTLGLSRFIFLAIAVPVSRLGRWLVTTRSKSFDLKSARDSETVDAVDTEYPLHSRIDCRSLRPDTSSSTQRMRYGAGADMARLRDAERP